MIVLTILSLLAVLACACTWPLRRRTSLPPAASGVWHHIVGLSQQQAEEMMDWLENQGCTGLQIHYQSTEGYTIRYQVPRQLLSAPR